MHAFCAHDAERARERPARVGYDGPGQDRRGSRQSSKPARVLAAALVSSILVMAGCGGSADDEEGATDADSGSDRSTSDEGATLGTAGTGTLSLADGTEYTFEMATCKTSGADPDAFVVDPGYDLLGKSEDGFRLTLIRAGLDADSANATGDLEAEFDENGVNPKVSYDALGDEDVMLKVDGSGVTGTAKMTSSGSSAPLGENIEAMIDVTC